MVLTEEQSLRQAIAHEEANLTTLEQKQQESRKRLATLRAELTAIASPISIPSTSAIQPSADIPTTPKEKISVFRKLFRGRNDVYPLLWISSKTGRKGYSPACGNEWVRGICEKTRVKCSVCPNQDTLPRGGFGNLIALPLQYEPRQAGNSVFLDLGFQPHPDQWAYLSSLKQITPSTVESIANEANQRGKVVGVRFSSGNEVQKNEAPWMRLPSRQSETKRITEPVPKRVHAVLAQRLFVDKADLPSPLLNQMKRLAAFQNPEFYKKQNMRLSTALTPRVISCAEEFSKHIALPRGCKDELVTLLNHYGSKLVIDDQRNSGEILNVRFSGKLTATQKQAANALCKHETGIFVAPPGIGKTVIGTWLIAERQCNTLVLVHRQPLLDQWVEQLALFLELDTKDIGRIGGGKRKPNGQLDVAMIQSLVRKD